ncbi:phage protein [Bifidobacterium sp. DSM 109960]|uniref:Phage protein n=2 Tax=Bifidobacterium TaxID=1678 RepID=A0A7Y0ETT8_9BIFI|nr:phage protein [Bifidobacterium sp. DSM 109960]
MACAFAAIPDLEEVWRVLDETDRTKAERLLDAASRKIRLQCPSWRQAEEAEPGICKDICCAMVKRAMLASDDTAGVSQHTETAGSYSESYSYANPTGDLYLTSAERSDLDSAGAGHMFTVSMTGGAG